MASPENPYQPPATVEPMVSAELVEGGLWRKDGLLVMHKTARLPDRCVKTNRPAQRRLKRTFYWHHPALYAALILVLVGGIIGILVYVGLSLTLRKSATIHVGLSEPWFARRRRAIIIGWLLALLFIPVFASGVMLVDTHLAWGWLMALALLMLLVGALYGLLGARIVTPKRIDGEFVWLKGVHPDYLSALPEWPHEP